MSSLNVIFGILRVIAQLYFKPSKKSFRLWLLSHVFYHIQNQIQLKLRLEYADGADGDKYSKTSINQLNLFITCYICEKSIKKKGNVIVNRQIRVFNVTFAPLICKIFHIQNF